MPCSEANVVGGWRVRSTYALSLGPFGSLGGLVLYAIRLVHNVAAQAFFPVLLTDRGDIYWIGVAYWVYGLMAHG